MTVFSPCLIIAALDYVGYVISTVLLMK